MKRMPGVRRMSGFTLIELLIVVAIIAILAAIAVPNFLEAQTRSKVSRVKADFRSLATALEAYVTDTNHYPLGRSTGGDLTVRALVELTTPVAYMTSVNFKDPFTPKGRFGPWLGYAISGNTINSYLYFNLGNGPDPGDNTETWAERANVPANYRTKGWVLSSNGPDRCQDEMERNANGLYTDAQAMNTLYDPTNGTVSGGDIGRCGGVIPAQRAAWINQ